uniref:Uncharacterized protein n=1 Tax=Lepisosteus oculatus TaxID=7918 RepID=W5M3W5_LEPOC
GRLPCSRAPPPPLFSKSRGGTPPLRLQPYRRAPGGTPETLSGCASVLPEIQRELGTLAEEEDDSSAACQGSKVNAGAQESEWVPTVKPAPRPLSIGRPEDLPRPPRAAGSISIANQGPHPPTGTSAGPGGEPASPKPSPAPEEGGKVKTWGGRGAGGAALHRGPESAASKPQPSGSPVPAGVSGGSSAPLQPEPGVAPKTDQPVESPHQAPAPQRVDRRIEDVPESPVTPQSSPPPLLQAAPPGDPSDPTQTPPARDQRPLLGGQPPLAELGPALDGAANQKEEGVEPARGLEDGEEGAGLEAGQEELLPVLGAQLPLHRAQGPESVAAVLQQPEPGVAAALSAQQPGSEEDRIMEGPTEALRSTPAQDETGRHTAAVNLLVTELSPTPLSVGFLAPKVPFTDAQEPLSRDHTPSQRDDTPLAKTAPAVEEGANENGLELQQVSGLEAVMEEAGSAPWPEEVGAAEAVVGAQVKGPQPSGPGAASVPSGPSAQPPGSESQRMAEKAPEPPSPEREGKHQDVAPERPETSHPSDFSLPQPVLPMTPRGPTLGLSAEVQGPSGGEKTLLAAEGPVVDEAANEEAPERKAGSGLEPVKEEAGSGGGQEEEEEAAVGALDGGPQPGGPAAELPSSESERIAGNLVAAPPPSPAPEEEEASPRAPAETLPSALTVAPEAPG